jgi:exodeoxyribonuclease-1
MASFLFYDLETSGFSPRSARIMQFAGQRTDMDMRAIGEPFYYYIKLTPDILPEPNAVLLTGITPQKTLSDGITEADFLKVFYKEIVLPGTIFVGFNNIRFDDEFIRFLNYRNFYDAYGWQWKDSCSRWDMLEVVRMTRALRPEGIEWPFASDGKPTNRLEMLTAVNKIDHVGAHDALSDVKATIAVAKLIKDKQPDLFKYLLEHRDKKSVAKLVEQNEPFVYTSSHFSSKYLHTTAVIRLASNPSPDSSLVYDLREDPTEFLKMEVDELIKYWQYNKDPEALRLPVKTLKYNRTPAIAPLGVIKNKATQERISLSLDTITKNLSFLRAHQESFTTKLLKAVEKLDQQRKATQTGLINNPLVVDEQLYDGFISQADATISEKLRHSSPEELSELEDKLQDKRLKTLLPLYKARNYPKSLTSEEQMSWEAYVSKKILEGKDSRISQFFASLKERSEAKPTKEQKYLLEELRLYAESIVPSSGI